MSLTTAQEFFIKPSDVIKRIREILPLTFADRVAGAAQFDAIEDFSKVKSPSCFVTLSDNATTIISEQADLDMDINHGFDVVLIMDTVDRRNQQAEELVPVFKGAFLYALNGWSPETSETPMSWLTFVGDSWRSTDRSYYMRVFRFNQLYRWNLSEDGSIGEETMALPDFDALIGQIIDEDGATTDFAVEDLKT